MKKKRSFKLNIEAFVLIVLLSVSSVFLAFSGGSFILNFKQIGFSVSSGTEKAVYNISSFIGESVAAVRELWELKSKYAELTKQLEKYELLERSNADIRRENEQLRSLLKFADSIRITNIPSEIIGYDPNALYSSMIINRGAKHGIRKDMPVIAFQNGNMALVGKIVQVGRASSMIIPVYDYRCFVAAKTDSAKHRGIVNGQGSADSPLIMKYIKKRAADDIKVGDKIVTSGFDESSLFPKNIPIGFVSKIKIQDYDTFLELSVEPIIDFSCLEYVFVIDSEKREKEF
ncbi:rod shape-determining protein MreC [Treponema pedis]|uniref:Cell shape-determining protein MreC n=2 Tax=Treponema pedis TaxID=409322 RepID=S5ZVF1_9SPIR|nr:rod shape-determining protein MreC [Treponema pedis]AGT44260.1 rod shape-determining protein MreC [Treponema pedis str. T A4]QOW62025.1 rod shape-determining protein MreC [Treponema pedis]QSI04967.1 rod shape-determining protein MreC [Treponema pedis]